MKNFLRNRARQIKLLMGTTPLVIAFFVTGSAFAATPPHVSFGVSVSQNGGWGQMSTTVTSNPDAYNERAYVVCYNGNTYYGGWHTSGTSTANCPSSSHIAGAGKMWDKTHLYFVQCWGPGQTRTGSC